MNVLCYELEYNPELKLPEPEPAGDWLVTYDLGNSRFGNATEKGG